MSSPFIFIATNRVKPGALERKRKRVPDLVEFIEANEPRLIAFNQYVNETGDATVRIQVFGEPTDAIFETLRQQAGTGVEITVNGEHLGGFTRSAAQP